MAAGMLCKRGTIIYLKHHWAEGWKCKHCGFQLDTKDLFKR